MTKDTKVSLNEAAEEVKKVCKRLAMLHLAYAKTLVEELGEEKGIELVLKAIKQYGISIGEEAKARANALGRSLEPENYVEDLPQYGMHESMEKVKINGESRVIARGCVMGRYWNEMGMGDLGRLYCFVDIAKYMAFNPNYKMVHIKALPDGDDYCEFAIKLTDEQEKMDFLRHDKDWRYIDR